MHSNHSVSYTVSQAVLNLDQAFNEAVKEAHAVFDTYRVVAKLIEVVHSDRGFYVKFNLSHDEIGF